MSALLMDLARADAVEDATPVFRPGQVVGRFEVVREVGRGGLGVVYEARDRQLGRAIALKALRPIGNPGVNEQRLLREAEAAARLSHPNIVMLLDVGHCDQGSYLVLDLLHGQTLAASLAQGAIATGEAIRIAGEVARGVAHAHAHGVIHRDLTPGNVFLCEDGQVKVLDFGMAQAFGRRRIDGGTRSYMAPEQWRGAPEDERTDVFALGVILFRMLTGELPFASPDELETSRQSPGVEVPGAPAVGELVQGLLEKDPVKRPRNMEDVLVALNTCVQQLGRTPAADAATAHRPRRRRRDEPSRRKPTKTIAVLPFVNMSADAEQEYFSDGLAEEVLNALAHVDGLRVTGRTSSFSFKGKNADLRDIGETLGVGAVLEGSVRKARDRVRITAHLVRVADGYHVWSHSYDREMTDIFAVQDEIARAVVDALKLKLLRGKGPSTRRRFTPDVDVYNQYLLGRHFYNRGTVDGFRLAVDAYRKALAMDPGYAPAQAALAPALHWLSDTTAESRGGILEGQRQAVEAAEKAVALAPDLADGFAARGTVRTYVAWDWTGAHADFEQALALKPGDAPAQHGEAHLMAVLGRLPAAIEMAREVARMDPLATDAWTYLGAYCNAAGELALARAALERALEIAPEHFIALEELGLCHLLRGEPEAALRVFERLTLGNRRAFGQALAQHDLGRAPEAQRALDELVDGWSYVAAYQVAEAHAWRGELDSAFEWLDRSYAQRDPGLRRIKYDPRLRKLHGDARYAAILRRLNLPLE
jgi:eukaryotic-like serine/threonine-protein kinase